MYHVTELSKQFGLSRSTLLYYDRIGLLKPSERSAANYRLYSASDRDRLAAICSLRQAGMDIDGIRALLDAEQDDTTSILRRRLDQIGARIQGLRTQQRMLAGMLRLQGLAEPLPSVDREMFVAMLRAAGMDDDAMSRLHCEFERRAPEAHRQFLMSLGISETEVQWIRRRSRTGAE